MTTTNLPRKDFRAALLSAALLCLGSSAVRAQTGDVQWSDEFDRSGITGRIFGLGTFNGDLYAGGDGFVADGQVLGTVARFDGTHWQPLGSGIQGFGSPQPGGLDRKVDAFIEYDGKLIVGGDFYAAGGMSLTGIAAWDGTQWSSMGLGLGLPQTLGGLVFELAEFQGELYAAGDFTIETVATGAQIYGVARWDGVQWRDVGGSLDPNDTLAHARSVFATATELYLGGDFNSVGGVAAQGIAVWNGATWSPLGSGTPGSVDALAMYQGKLFAGGYFFSMGGVPALKLAAWDGTSWQAVGTGIPETSIGTSVDDFVVHGTDLFISGGFHESDGVSSRSIIRYDGTQFHSMGGVFGSGQITAVIAMTVWNGKLVLGGEFSRASAVYPDSIGQSLASKSIVAHDGTQWVPVSRGLGFDGGPAKLVHFGGGIVAVGNFSEAGSTYTSAIAFFDGTDWQHIGSVQAILRDAIVFEGDLVIAGDFTSVSGVSADGIARYNGTSWSGMGSGAPHSTLEIYQGELYAGGTGPAKRWNGTSWVDFGTPIFGQTNDFHVYNGKLYIGGSFGGFSGPGPNLATWDGTTTASIGTVGTVGVMETFEGDLLVGGSLLIAVAGVSTGPLARYDGNTWSSFGGITGTAVYELEVFRGELYASGDLIQSFGDPRDYVARWNGSSWNALGSGPDGPALTMLADDAAGSLYMGGAIRYVGDGIPSWYFARWDAPQAGVAFCFGDGSGSSCPCGNEDSVNPGHGGCLNSSLQGARLAASGVASVQSDTLSFVVTGATPSSFGVLVSADNQLGMPSGNGIIAFDGLRCVGGNLLRHGTRALDASGANTAAWGSGGGPAGGLISQGGFGVGQTRQWQVFYRESDTQICQSGQNTTNAVAVTIGS